MVKITTVKASGIIGGYFTITGGMYDPCIQRYAKETVGNVTTCYKETHCADKFGGLSIIREVIAPKNCDSLK
ncbi:hypothetical protein [Serratia sp. 2723]|uniref:hypothetical protein n=1 Tax=unclassified Serratia (in: enterobacteria) TaxID=2647522 RepID=UPI003D19913C